MPNCLALGTWSPSFVSFLEENIHRRKSVGRKSYRVSKNKGSQKNKCSLAQWSRGAYQLQVRLFGTQNMEPIVCFFFERKHPRKKVIRKQKIRVSKKNEIKEAWKNYIYETADILGVHLSLWLPLNVELYCLALRTWSLEICFFVQSRH